MVKIKVCMMKFVCGMIVFVIIVVMLLVFVLVMG